ncbi:hypothetical protein HPB50_004430 [Hyalomma asiaticum]|uniref:Uncharacterized protein n=1 Tax=Hyalomma asiaticum TaxID=266040 RepID=A0ACB7TC68_HYAAI|nr:hypothetical protein HPB50_004430 [Hyalomma asiaticum]
MAARMRAVRSVACLMGHLSAAHPDTAHPRPVRQPPACVLPPAAPVKRVSRGPPKKRGERACHFMRRRISRSVHIVFTPCANRARTTAADNSPLYSRYSSARTGSGKAPQSRPGPDAILGKLVFRHQK